MLKTKNIYIDTQAFVANNYFQNENLKRLAELGKNGEIVLFMTEITRHEIINNVAEDLLQAVGEINEFKRRLGSKGKVLKNIDQFRQYIELPKLEFEVQMDKLSQDLDLFLAESKITMIPYQNADLKKVVSNYFLQAKPFGPGKKKHEFPDAIVVSSIEKWCEKNSQKMYLISGDRDMGDLGTESILTIRSIKDILDIINKKKNKERKIWIDYIFEANKDRIKKMISKKFRERLEDEIGHDIELEDVRITNMVLGRYSIVQDDLNSGETVLQLDFDVEFVSVVIYEDYSFGFYNKESDRHFGSTRNRDRVNARTTQTAEVFIESSLDDKNTPYDDDITISCSTSIPNADLITNQLDGYRYNWR